jgi:hypothetical protein
MKAPVTANRIAVATRTIPESTDFRVPRRARDFTWATTKIVIGTNNRNPTTTCATSWAWKNAGRTDVDGARRWR